jgi:hypothetical protein
MVVVARTEMESENAQSRHVGCRSNLVLSTQEGQTPPSHARASHQAGQRQISEVTAMKFALLSPTPTLKPPPAS